MVIIFLDILYVGQKIPTPERVKVFATGGARPLPRDALLSLFIYLFICYSNNKMIFEQC